MMRLSELMAAAPGLELVRDADLETLGYLHHEGASKLSWIENEKYLPLLLRSENLHAVVASPTLASQIPASLGLILHPAPRAAFYLIHNFLAAHTAFYRSPSSSQIDPSANIHPKAHVDETGVRIGPGVRIDAGAIILDGSVIGAGAIVRSGAVIGAQGFEYTKFNETTITALHVGGTLLEEQVEVHSNSTVVRAIFGHAWTVVGTQTKLDSHVHIAHHCSVGKRSFLAAAVTLSGSVSIGDDVWIGPGSTISNGLRVGSGSRITIGSVVVSSVPAGAHVTGNWAIPHPRFVMNYARTLAPAKK